MAERAQVRCAVCGAEGVCARCGGRSFGLERGEERTLSEVAEMMGVSRERIRQIEQAALAKLRRLPGLKNEVFEYLAA